MNQKKIDKKIQKAEKKAEKQLKKEARIAAKEAEKNAKIAEKENKKAMKEAKKANKKAEKEAKKKKSKMKSSTRKKVSVVLVLLLLLIFAGMASMYLYHGYQNRDRFFQNVTINGINVTGLTVKETEEIIREKTENYQLTIVGRDNTEVTITQEDINYKYVPGDSIQKHMDNQIWWKWGLNYLQIDKQNHEVAIGIEYDESKVRNLVNSWAFVLNENQTDSADAHLEYQNGSFVLIEELYGTRMDFNIFYDAVIEAIDNSQPELDIEEVGAYTTSPAILADDPVLNKNMEFLNANATCTITYNLPDGSTNAVTPEMLLTWMAIDEQGYYYLDDDFLNLQIQTYITELNKIISGIKVNDVTFKGKLGEMQTVASYVTGAWAIDTEKEIAQLTTELKANENVTREPVYSKKLYTEDGRLAETYVEIDMSAQHLWYFVNGEVVVESDIVSGTYTNESRRTPEGLYKLTYKQKDRVLKGAPDETGKPSYESPVDFWMPFNGGIGMHDADGWRSRYGGTIYKYSGSHGCINMPRKNAAALYDLIQPGCLVVCYY